MVALTSKYNTMLQKYLLTTKPLGYMPNYHGNADTSFHFLIHEKMRFSELKSSPSSFLNKHQTYPILFKTFYQSRIRRYLTQIFPFLLLGKFGKTHDSDFRVRTSASESDFRASDFERNDSKFDLSEFSSINLIAEFLSFSDFRSWYIFIIKNEKPKAFPE